jgi:hypothetical protein
MKDVIIMLLIPEEYGIVEFKLYSHCNVFIYKHQISKMLAKPNPNKIQ